MPRYFFNIVDGNPVPDLDGSVLLDIHEARAEAVRLSGDILREIGAAFWDLPEWKLEVCNEAGQLLFTLRFSADSTLQPTLDPGAGTPVDRGDQAHGL